MVSTGLTIKTKLVYENTVLQNDYYRMLVILPSGLNDIRYVERRIGLLDVKAIDERLDMASANSEVDVLMPRYLSGPRGNLVKKFVCTLIVYDTISQWSNYSTLKFFFKRLNPGFFLFIFVCST